MTKIKLFHNIVRQILHISWYAVIIDLFLIDHVFGQGITVISCSCFLFSFLIHRATVLYDQPPEFFRPAELEEKHKVKQTSFKNNIRI